jgi:hypothetical protein
LPITYDAPSNTIAVVGGPYGLVDIYNADVVGGWGKVHRQGTSQYAFDAKVKIGDGSTATTFTDTKKQVYFNLGIFTDYYQSCFDVMNNAVFTLGVLNDAATHDTNSGCMVALAENLYYPYIVHGETGSTVYLYSCAFSCVSTAAYVNAIIYLQGTGRIWNCYGSKQVVIGWALATSPDAFNVTLNSSNTPLWNLHGTVNKVVVTGQYSSGGRNGVIFFNAPGTITARGVTMLNEAASFYFFNQGVGQNLYAIDCSCAWLFTWENSAGAICYRQNSVNLKITDKANNAISGATVTLVDKSGTQVFSVLTAADGTIAEQVVTRGTYTQATLNVLQDLSPHTLTISKTGYQTYVKKFVLSDKVVWEIKLAKSHSILVDKGNPVVNLNASDPDNVNVFSL